MQRDSIFSKDGISFFFIPVRRESRGEISFEK